MSWPFFCRCGEWVLDGTNTWGMGPDSSSTQSPAILPCPHGYTQQHQWCYASPPPLLDQHRVDQIFAHLPGQEESSSQDQQQSVSIRDTPVWLISTGIYGFVDECRKAGMPPEELSPLLSTAVARSSPLTVVTQRWLDDLSDQLPKQGSLLRCKIVSTDL